MNLADMLNLQQGLQTRYQDGDPTTMRSTPHRIAFITEQFGNMIHELCEAHDEITWKSWHEGELRIEAEMSVKELVDVWHFFLNWLLCLRPMLGFDNNEELAEWFMMLFERKNQENHQRRSSGSYEGHSHQVIGGNDG
jgi:hypothetical protein